MRCSSRLVAQLAHWVSTAFAPVIRPSVWRSLVAAVLGASLAACLDTPEPHDPSVARLITTWDPLGCGDPHRVAVELADEMGVQASASAPCELGAVTVDVAHLGSYGGRIYAWAIGAPIRSIVPLTVNIDAAIVRQRVATPE